MSNRGEEFGTIKALLEHEETTMGEANVELNAARGILASQLRQLDPIAETLQTQARRRRRARRR